MFFLAWLFYHWYNYSKQIQFNNYSQCFRVTLLAQTTMYVILKIPFLRVSRRARIARASECEDVKTRALYVE